MERLEAAKDPVQTPGLGERRSALLRYVIKLTRTPAEMDESDVKSLREVGFEDADVLAICEVAGYYAYVNRIADGLGVALESYALREDTDEA